MKLEVRLFRFNKERDYLPAYPPFHYRPQSGQTLLDLLIDHQNSNPLFLCDLACVPGVRVNGTGLTLTTPLEKIVQQMGTDLVIELLDTRLATQDLLIDTRDFERPLALLPDLITQSDRDLYHQHLIAYYSSPVRRFNPHYQGEAFFMVAEALLERHPQARDRILKTIACPEGGVWYYCGVRGTLLEGYEPIDAAIERLQLAASDWRPKGAPMACGYTPLQAEGLERFSDRRVALCLDGGPFGTAADATLYSAALSQAGARVVGEHPFAPTGSHLADLNPEVAFAMAASVMRAAMDAGAELLCCAHKESADFLITQKRAITRAAGQPLDLEVLSLEATQQAAA